MAAAGLAMACRQAEFTCGRRLWRSTPEAAIVQRKRRSPRCSMSCDTDCLTEAIAINNGVPQGLSSAIFT